MKLKNLLLMFMVIALFIAPAGCIFSPDDGGDGGGDDTGLPWASTPDILMSNYRIVYTEMLIDEFTEMLHKDYKTILLSETLEDWGEAADFYFDYTAEVEIHTKMFRGDPGLDSQGNPVHPIDSIVVDLLENQGTWDPIPQDDIDFGGMEGKWANYRVNLQFFNADLSHKFEVHQQINFYVVPVVENGRNKYLMLGQRGLPLEPS